MSTSSLVEMQIVALWIPRISGTISIIGSLAIICSLWRKDDRLALSNFRFLFAMSVVDILSSLSLAVSSAALPRGDFYGAIGNKVTCATQGFLLQFGTAVPYYNASLCLFAYYSIRFNYTPQKFARTIEPYCHAFSLLFPLLTAIAILSLGLFNGGNESGGGHWCWIYVNEQHDMEYSNAKYATALLWIFAGIPVGIISLVVYYCMWCVYRYVSRQNSHVRRQNLLGRLPTTMNMHKIQTARQALLFSSAFIVTFLFIGLENIFIAAGRDEVRHPTLFAVLRILQSTFYPLQGFWNFIIHFLPIIASIKRRNPTIGMLRAFQIALFNVNETNTRQRNDSLPNGMFPLPVINENEQKDDLLSSPLAVVDCVKSEISISVLSEPTCSYKSAIGDVSTTEEP